jgi:hypothetical protein
LGTGRPGGVNLVDAKSPRRRTNPIPGAQVTVRKPNSLMVRLVTPEGGHELCFLEPDGRAVFDTRALPIVGACDCGQ